MKTFVSNNKKEVLGRARVTSRLLELPLPKKLLTKSNKDKKIKELKEDKIKKPNK